MSNYITLNSNISDFSGKLVLIDWELSAYDVEIMDVSLIVDRDPHNKGTLTSTSFLLYKGLSFNIN